MARGSWEEQGIVLQSPDSLARFQSAQAAYHDDLEDDATDEPTIFTSAFPALLSWLQ